MKIEIKIKDDGEKEVSVIIEKSRIQRNEKLCSICLGMCYVDNPPFGIVRCVDCDGTGLDWSSIRDDTQ